MLDYFYIGVQMLNDYSDKSFNERFEKDEAFARACCKVIANPHTSYKSSFLAYYEICFEPDEIKALNITSNTTQSTGQTTYRIPNMNQLYDLTLKRFNNFQPCYLFEIDYLLFCLKLSDNSKSDVGLKLAYNCQGVGDAMDTINKLEKRFIKTLPFSVILNKEAMENILQHTNVYNTRLRSSFGQEATKHIQWVLQANIRVWWSFVSICVVRDRANAMCC